MAAPAMRSRFACVTAMAVMKLAIALRPNRQTARIAGCSAKPMPANIIAAGIILKD